MKNLLFLCLFAVSSSYSQDTKMVEVTMEVADSVVTSVWYKFFEEDQNTSTLFLKLNFKNIGSDTLKFNKRHCFPYYYYSIRDPLVDRFFDNADRNFYHRDWYTQKGFKEMRKRVDKHYKESKLTALNLFDNSEKYLFKKTPYTLVCRMLNEGVKTHSDLILLEGARACQEEIIIPPNSSYRVDINMLPFIVIGKVEVYNVKLEVKNVEKLFAGEDVHVKIVKDSLDADLRPYWKNNKWF